MPENMEIEMRVAFEKQCRKILDEHEKFEVKDKNTLTVGLESEVAVHGRFDQSELTQKRNAIVEYNQDFTDLELGASQIEIRTPPVDLSRPSVSYALESGSFKDLEHIYKSRFNKILESARSKNVSILRAGANPFLPVKETPRTDKPKYKLVPDFYNQHRNPFLDTTIGLGKTRIDVGDAAIVSLFQSFQINLGAISLTDACDKMNRSLAIAPYLLAFTGNARYLNCFDTGIQDVRMMSWEASHDTRVFCDTKFQDLRLVSWEKSFAIDYKPTNGWVNESRVGLPSRYFRDIEDYLLRAGSFPFILDNPEAATAIAVGMTWLDARVKFINDIAVVELRLPSTQPTIEEELVLTMLYIGRLHYSQEINEPLLPISLVKENRLLAMLYGTKKPMWFLNDKNHPIKVSPKIGLDKEFKKALRGLEYLGLSKYFNQDLLAEMLRLGLPSERLANKLGKSSTITFEDMEQALLWTGMLLG